MQAPSTRVTREQLVKRDDLHAIAPLVTLGLDIEVMTMVRVIRRVWRRVRGCMCVEGVCVWTVHVWRYITIVDILR